MSTPLPSNPMGSPFFDESASTDATLAEGPSFPRGSTVSSRISNILSVSYADQAIRDALQTLQSRGASDYNQVRRHFYHDVQKETIQCNAEVVQDFGKIAVDLHKIGELVAVLRERCTVMRNDLDVSRSEINPVLKESKDLLEKSSEVEQKRDLLDATQTHFMVHELSDISASIPPGAPGDEFFEKIVQVKRIRRDCQVLLGAENQSLGLQIMEQASKRLNGLFQSLFNWVQREFKTLDLENPQISAAIRRSLRALSERPSLFRSCLDAFSVSREAVLSDSFHAALTGSVGGDQKQPSKPIELIAHEPIRYAGDMLAWIHSATVSEREALEALFIGEGREIAKGLEAGRDDDPWSVDEEGVVFDPRTALAELVDRNLSSVARLLRQRAEQVIHSHDDPGVAFKIANLVAFYRSILSKLLGGEGSVADTLRAIETSANRQFKAGVRDHIAALEHEKQVIPDHCAPPEFLADALRLIGELMITVDTSIDASGHEEQISESVLEEALDPFLEHSKAISNHAEKPDRQVFALNCLLATKSALQPFSFTKSRLGKIKQSLEGISRELTDYQYSRLLESSGIMPLMDALNRFSDADRRLLSALELPILQPQSVLEIGQQLDDFLPSALMDATEIIRDLRDPDLARQITEEAAELFCEDFEQLEHKISTIEEQAESAGRPGLRQVFPRTTAEIRVLLS
ncbi:oligomeric complex COG6 [Eremomyces bilateralis CBS 781.70]|uniref:Conserved oligomeric Golgi complex subunit 6 n=1 Tax=Eremomyces bilateralis CBS 781.70 TaxID=1392243 RepID=A0A6G1FTD7_9PEZI|nr:oligomeric complex COG6 [Eremomyces bilateralis CBS 781.70]KAF1809000.1 oligomeric complex COG6 [Eremomyces bilateralis CBS 781.70]